MSWHYHFIPLLAKIMDIRDYLELGVYDGQNINEISQFVPNCVGVDTKIHSIKNPKFTFHQETTDEFFSYNTTFFDLIFIDACHDFENVKKDFDNSIERLRPNGVILIHDTCPVSEKDKESGYCSDAYKIKDYIKTHGDYARWGESFTIESFPGLTMYRFI